jgi:hypothetical protein
MYGEDVAKYRMVERVRAAERARVADEAWRAYKREEKEGDPRRQPGAWLAVAAWPLRQLKRVAALHHGRVAGVPRRVLGAG